MSTTPGMTTLWKLDPETRIPAAVLVTLPWDYLDHDEDGEAIYENTHWEDEAKAWREGADSLKLRTECEARAIKDCESRLAKVWEKSAVLVVAIAAFLAAEGRRADRVRNERFA